MTSLVILPPANGLVQRGRATLIQRALASYPSKTSASVKMLASRHPWLADLAVSFPVLLVALALPCRKFDPEPVIERVMSGAPLAELAKMAKVPLWSRRLPAEACVSSPPPLPDGDIFKRRIVNHLPPRKHASHWLNAISDAHRFGHSDFALWLARHFEKNRRHINRQRIEALGLWAWISVQTDGLAKAILDEPWKPDITFKRACQAAGKWFEGVELCAELGESGALDCWLKPGTLEDVDFVPLATIADLVAEARAMKNCVRTYGFYIRNDRARLWSMRQNGERLATVEIRFSGGDRLASIHQIKGPLNRQPSLEHCVLARRWLNSHEMSALVPPEPRQEKCLNASENWRLLWREYWLSKKSLPQWLPLCGSSEASARLRRAAQRSFW